MQLIVRNGQFLSAFSPACCQHSSAIGSCHAFTKTVFISSFSLRRLERSFHRFCILFVVFKNRSANVGYFLNFSNTIVNLVRANASELFPGSGGTFGWQLQS
jgi:hypothetical protein